MSTTITDYAGLVNISNDLTGDYVLGNDIDAVGQTWTPLGTFTGTLDGVTYKITNLTSTINTSGAQTFAFITTNQGTIQNLGFTDCAISVTSTDRSARASCIAYENDGGTISNCYVTGTIASTAAGSEIWTASAGGIAVDNENSGIITKCYSTATISATSTRHAYAGGLVAVNVATISKSYATGTITVTSTYSGSTSARVWAGGFVASNGYTDWNGSTGTITDCYAMGDATASIGYDTTYAGGFVAQQDTAGSSITNCYSMGTPSGIDATGGFCGVNNSGTFTGCFWDTETSGDATSDGGTGKTTAQMNTTSTFTDASWDFTEIWNRNWGFNDGYPALRWSDICDSDSETRTKTIGPVYDPKGRVPKGARVEARRADTGVVAETEELDANGKATFTELPNDTDVTFWVAWGGTTQALKTDQLYSTIIGVSEGGTGSSDEYTARSNLGLGSEDSPWFTAIELGHATDTTIARDSAGKVSVEGIVLIRSAAYVVAANDSYIKTQADATCDGTDD